MEPDSLSLLTLINKVQSHSVGGLRCLCFQDTHSFRLARPEISPLERFLNGFVQKPNFSCTEPSAYIITTYFESSLTVMSVIRLLNLVQLQLKSASETIQPV